MNSPVQASHSLRVFITVILVIVVLRYAQDVFVPLALAVLMTFLLAPFVEFLSRWHVNRALAVIVSVAIAVAAVGALLYIVFDQLTDVVQELPRYRRQLRANLLEVSHLLSGGMSGTSEAVEQLSREIARATPRPPTGHIPAVQVVPAPVGTWESLRAFVSPFVKPVGTAAVVIVFAIFMLLRLHDLRDRIIRLLGQENLRTTTEALADAAQRVSRYLLMQTLINTWQGAWVAAGLWYLGLPNAVLWGALTVVLRFIPYIGPWVAAAMPVALSLAVFDRWTKPLLVVGLFVVLELISNMVLEPWLYGKRTGVTPLALLVAATFWVWLWGAVGLFLAIPLTVCLMVMGKHIPQLEFLYVLLGDEPMLDPHEQLYHRFLSGKREDADGLLVEALRTRSPRKVSDDILIPAVRLAEKDHAAGSLEEAQRKIVREVIEDWAKKLADAHAPVAAVRRLADCSTRVAAWSG